MKPIYPIVILAAGTLISGCTTIRIMKSMSSIQVSPAHFAYTLPMTLPRNESMLVQVAFKKEHTTRTLKIDNHAPVALVSRLLENNNAMKRIGEAPIKRKTANGEAFKNTAYKTDSIALGPVVFNGVTFFSVPDRTDNRGKEYDGYLGNLILESAIWKFDFEHLQVTVTSALDSLPDIGSARKLNAKLTATGAFKVPVRFQNGLETDLEVDLGYNREVLLPPTRFQAIDTGRRADVKQGMSVSAAGESQQTKSYLYKEPLTIGGEQTTAQIATGSTNNQSLLGLGYFIRHQYVILDYLHGSIYLSAATRK